MGGRLLGAVAKGDMKMGADEERSGKSLTHPADIIWSAAGEPGGDVSPEPAGGAQPASGGACSNGVCAVGWKPVRPAAA